jgi:putative transposase
MGGRIESYSVAALGRNTHHKRSGHLFQNRYKSILCEEDPYLLELVRYIHLNPLRAKMVGNLESLDAYPYSGHSAIMGTFKRPWVDSAYVLSLFHRNRNRARTLYRSFVAAGIKQGHREDLAGGGLLRSNKGWIPAKDSDHRKGDQRILGSSEFVQEVLKTSQETWERTCSHRMRGVDFSAVQEHVARIFAMDPEELLLPGKYRNRSIARSVLCYFVVRELGMTATAVAAKLGIGQPAVSIAVARGEAIVRERALRHP